MERPPTDLNAASILAFLDERRARSSIRSGTPDQVRGYREAAAVLSAIADLKALRPVDARVGDVKALDALGKDLILASGAKLAGSVMLAPEVRQRTLAELAASGRLAAALAANPQERHGPLQEHLERYLQGTAPPIEVQSLETLAATHQVLLWLGDAVPNLPDLREVQARTSLLRLMAPFEVIAGDGIFRGRKRELDLLRRFVGVLPPSSILQRIKDAAFKWTEPERQPALTVFGPGGAGKSALIARFILEHSRVAENGRVPFAYLDFDRPALDVGDPVGLCVEMIRQLDTEFPGENRFGGLRRTADEQAHDSLPAADPQAQLNKARDLLAELLGTIRSSLGPRPYIVVLDTFEEVQYRGESRAFPMWQLLDELQAQAPFLRVVLSGRAPADSLRLGGAMPNRVEVGDLDEEGAIAFLAAQGVTDGPLAARLVKSFGGVPLSLKLAASLLVRHGEKVDALTSLAGRGSWFVKASTSVQGQLYDRLLGHIHDDRVRRLAHPGLVLRRITAELIQEVLNEPCELGIQNLADAQQLFEELRRETALVTADDLDESLVHRSDLRRVMLKLLVETEPARVEQIRRSAVKYYSRQKSGRRAKAEEIYHRLQMGEMVDGRELLDREIRGSIQASIVEFPAAVQVHLATVGLHVQEEMLKEATQEERDAALAAQIEELLPYGRRSLSEARQLLEVPARSLDRPSPLYRSLARVAAQRGDNRDAHHWIERGLELAVSAGQPRLTLGLIREMAWLERDADEITRAETLSRLADYANRHRDQEGILQLRLQTFGPDGPKFEDDMTVLIQHVKTTAPITIWMLAPAFVNVMERLRNHPEGEALAAQVRDRVLDGESPFRVASFPISQVQRRLDALYRVDSLPEFLEAFLKLCAEWPYQVLDVTPPYGRYGEALSESASAS